MWGQGGSEAAAVGWGGRDAASRLPPAAPSGSRQGAARRGAPALAGCAACWSVVGGGLAAPRRVRVLSARPVGERRALRVGGGFWYTHHGSRRGAP